MTTIELMVTLPEALAAQAKSAGLLEEGALARMLEAELERRERLDRLFADMEVMSATEPEITPDEIQAEIEAARAERKMAVSTEKLDRA